VLYAFVKNNILEGIYMAGKINTMKRIDTDEKTFETLYEEFQQYNKMKNLRPATIEFYYSNLKAIKSYLIEMGIKFIGEIQKHHVEAFILHLREHYSNAVTVNTYLRATRVLLYYAMTKNYLQPFEIKLIKQEKLVKETYSDEDIEKLVKKWDLKNCSFSQYRNWVMVQYFLETGNRLNTVINMKVGDLDLSAFMAVLKTTKNRKQMYSPIGSSLVKVLAEYIRAWGLTPEDYLFPNTTREQLKKNAIQNAMKIYNKSRGVEMTSIHAYRHTFAKNYVTSGGNAFKLQRLLGHSSLEITQQYVSLFSENLSEDFGKHSIINQYSTGNRLKR
jgi:integrase/recombinase XerD